MNILVLNGSPKGQYSITLQTVHYLERLYPEHTFHILHVGQRINALMSDFSPAAEAISNADVLLFAYPVYTFIAPYQMHCFIELLKIFKPSATISLFSSISSILSATVARATKSKYSSALSPINTEHIRNPCATKSVKRIFLTLNFWIYLYTIG